MLRPLGPVKLARTATALRRWGPTVAAGYAVASIADPEGVAIVDERGSLTFEAVHRRTNALARAWRDAGLAPGDSVAILCRNHRGLVEATVACAKLGANALFLNTAFAAPQIAEVCAREQPRAIVYDAGSRGRRERSRPRTDGVRRLAGWARSSAVPTLDDLIESADRSNLLPPAKRGRVVILTSGTSGAPKGANRHQPASLDPAAALLEAIPLRARERTLIAAPMFHSWGFAHLVLGIALGVDARPAPPLRRRRDPPSDRRARRHRARRRAGDAAADARARRARDRPPRPRRAARRRRQRLGAARRARHPRHGRVRRGPLQPLRLDRGRVGDGRHAA